MPYVPAVGFEYLVSATSVVANGAWVIRTGPFYALKIEGSNTMNFRVTFGLCFGTPDTNGICAQVSRNTVSSSEIIFTRTEKNLKNWYS